MAFTFDDIENNPFYLTLERKYEEKLKEAQKKLWVICVPYHKSLKDETFTLEFAHTHILKPSPFFKSHFVTTDAEHSLTFEIEDGHLKSSTGAVKILLESTAYNNSYKPYKILLIARPLCCIQKSLEDNLTETATKKELFSSLNECTVFLKSFPECSHIVDIINKKIQVFNSSYMVLPEYLLDTAAKLKVIQNWAIQEYMNHLAYRTQANYSVNDISVALENYLLYHVHDKVFPVIKMLCCDEDMQLTKKLLNLYDADVTPDQLGVQNSFCCQTPSAVVELASLNFRNCPAEKLKCLMTTLELLNEDIEKVLSDTCPPVGAKESFSLTSDDLIPLLVCVVSQARPQYFASNLYYIQNFCWAHSTDNKFCFGLTTFQAVKEFMKCNEFDFLKPSLKKIKKELSLEELMVVTTELQNSSNYSAQMKPPSFQSPTDHLLENVTRMIEASTNDLRNNSQSKVASSIIEHTNVNSAQGETVGNFLSSLRQRSLGLSYGKQN